MRVILPIREVLPATPRASIVRLALQHRRFDYMAGQAVLVGRTEQPDRRAYSLTTAPRDAHSRDELELLIGLDDGASHLGPLEIGTPLDVEGPFGGFTLMGPSPDPDLLFLAGGTGIAPLRAMLHEALGWPAPPDIAVLYSARTAQDFAYGPELRRLAASGRIQLWQTVTRNATAWDGAQGRIAVHHLRSMVDPHRTLCFVCGPHAFVHAVVPLLGELGVRAERIRVEDWGAGGGSEE
jgi:ferredoxin-NADP reductase